MATLGYSVSDHNIWSRLSTDASPKTAARIVRESNERRVKLDSKEREARLGLGSARTPVVVNRRASAHEPESTTCASDVEPSPRQPLITAALQAVFDGSDKMCTSRATVGLLFLSDLLPGTTKAKDFGQAALQRIFFSSMPEDLVEILDTERIVQPLRAFNFMQFLACRGSRSSSLNIDVMFSPNCGESDRETPFACMAHQSTPGLVNGEEEFKMNVAIVAVDPVLNDKYVLNVRSLAYRFTENGRSLSTCAREEKLQIALRKAMDAKLLLSDSPIG